jgi:hypothetical protein
MNEAANKFSLSGIKTPPQDLVAEQALLGSVMIKPDVMYDVSEVITPDDFYAEKHRKIFKSMVELHEKSEPIKKVNKRSPRGSGRSSSSLSQKKSQNKAGIIPPTIPIVTIALSLI